MPVLPFHCLVFCDNEQLDGFPPHERLSSRRVALDLVGHEAPDLRPIVLAELRHRVGLKLSLGQRVAVADCYDKAQLASLARAQGAQVVDLVDPASLALLPPADQPDYLHANWRGITVIGDSHGDLRALTRALSWAETRCNFVWLLGDVIDYGADTLATADMAYMAVMAGKAGMILGNHERKIARWLDQSETGRPHIRISDGNRVTINALNGLNSIERKQWIGRFRGLLAHASLMQQIGDITLLHAAAHPSLWHKPNLSLIEQFALYGEGEHCNGKFRRVHRWIDGIPAGKLVFVGHDVMAPFPMMVTGAKGGQAVFMDTGCGTGGYLSSADLRFSEHGLRLECFNRH